MTRKTTTYALFGLTTIIFSTTFLAIRLGILAGASPVLFAGLRFAVAGLALLIVLLSFRTTTFHTLSRLAGRSLLVSLNLVVIPFGAMYWAEKSIDSGLMARLDTLGPIVTAVFALGLMGKKLTGGHVVGLALGSVGTYLMTTGAVSTMSFPPWVPLLVAGASVVSYALGMVVYDKLFDAKDDPFTVNALQMLFGGAALLIVSPLLETPSFPMTSGTVLPLLFLIVAGSMIGHSATLVVIRNAGAVFASTWLYISPVLATVAGAVVLREPLAWAEIAGTVLALAGVFFVTRAEARPASQSA